MTEQEKQEQLELETLKRKSPYALPNNPSAAGWSASQIKAKMYEGLFYLYSLIKDVRKSSDKNVLEALKNKVDKVDGYGLSQNDFTDDLLEKLLSLENYDDSDITDEFDRKMKELFETVKAYVQEQVSNFTNISPEALQTLRDLEAAIKTHEDEYDALLETIGSKATKVELNEKIEQVKEELTEKIEENTYANKIIFDDGVSLEEKYANGELGSGGGGGSGVDDDVILTTTSPSTVACGKGDDILINYNFSREVQKTRTGSEKIYVDGTLYSTRYVSQGDNVATISNLSPGSHNIEIQITSSGLSASLVYSAEVIELTISSTFDGFGIYTNPITYRYTPVGNIQKTIHVIVDDKEYTQVVNESNKAMTYRFETLSHGNHKVSVYATAKVGDNDITSNVLTYDLVVNNGGSDTIIACPFDTTKITQGDLLQFNYVVFTPNSLTSEVSLKINGEEISNLTVDRTQQTWSLRNYPTGNIVCTIESGNKKVSFNIEVKAVDLKIEAISHNLELFLTSTGRSNNENESTRNVWENNGVAVGFSNFNWKSNGWIQDEDGNSVLRISGDARVTIPFNIFAEDFRSIGKTIEFEFSTHDVRDYDSILINCLSNGRGFSLTSNIAKLHSEQTSIETKFKEDEKVRVSFVIEPNTENSLIYTYVNGIISGLAQYPSDDNFSQSTPVGITIGSNDATIDLYNIRVYNINLDHSDVLTNYIADTPDRQTKFALYNNNDIFDSYGSMDYNKVVDRIPCLTFVGELPATKGDKKTVSVRYVNNFDSSKNFTTSGVSLDIQGTSSQYYPRKNYKFKLPTTYKLTNNSIPETVFCLKADYMESSHSHNTGLAKIVNTLYPTTPASQANNKVQAAITGFPIVVWYKETENSPLKCLGVYNFNNDKEDTTTFGYTALFPNCESWEFKNNTSAHCLFQNSDFEDTVEVAKNFEARYPDKYTNYTNLGRVVSWVASTEGDLEKFKNEFNNYFNLESTLLYYCLTELFAMVDSRAKNLFLTTWDGNIWYPTFYDMDTAFGLNNEGVNDFAYQVEYHDVQGSQNVFNGESSVLWNNFEQAYADEIQDFYNNLRNNKLVTYDTVMNVLYEQQISKICENNYNYDAVEKYKNPLIEDGIGTYLYVAQGNRLDHLKWWLHNRINYMDSKYVASDYKDNYITLRIYTPDSYGSVLPNADAHITPYADQYVTVKYDENMFNARGTHDVETVIDAPNQVFNDTPMIIYGASRISDIGDLSPLYAGTVDVSKGIKLKQLIVGNAASDYRNTNLKTLTIGNNELLTKLDVRNCPSLTQVIDASGCANIEEIYATGTSSTSVKVPNGGNLKVLRLPNTITNLTIQNQPFITDFVCGDYSKISTLRVENTPLNTLKIVTDADDSLERVRLIGVDWTVNDTTVLEKLKTLKGLDEKDNNTDKAVLTGKVHIKDEITSIYMDECIEFFGTNLTITADAIEWYYKCKFESYNGTLLEAFYVKEGEYATYSGETPTKPLNFELQESYTFSEWSPNINTEITSNTTFTPIFSVSKFYEVLFKNWDGSIIQTSYVDEGKYATYNGSTPTRPNDETYYYEFNGWNLSLENEIQDNTTFIAKYIPKALAVVTWLNWDGTELQRNLVSPYDTVAFTSVATKPDDNYYTDYALSGWLDSDGEFYEVGSTFTTTENMTLTAQFEGEPRTFTVYWYNGETLLATTQVEYGTLASYNGDIPTGDGVFKGWSKTQDGELTEDFIITGDTSFFAVCIKGTRIYLTNVTNTTDKPALRIGTPNANTSFNISWGDGNIETYTNTNTDITFITKSSPYANRGDYVIEIEPLDNLKIALSNWSTSSFKFLSFVTKVELSNTVTEIFGNAFTGCSSLASITIPNSITSIGNQAFKDCTSLTSITIPPNVTNIENYAFSGCSSLTSITIPNGVTKISVSAFNGCSSLTSITIPPNVTSIGSDAFSGCSSLTSITIPPNVTSIGSNAFSGCSSLTSITVDENNTVYDSRENCNAIIETATNTLKFGCKNTIIPATITKIGSSAFDGRTNLTSIIIPDSVTIIEGWVFYKCTNLTSITIPSTVTSIGSYAFSGCSSLTSITIPDSVTIIKDWTFNGCSSLTSITIPPNVTSIGSDAFSGCRSLTNITIPESVTTIGSDVFMNCRNMTSITIPSSVTNISGRALWIGTETNKSTIIFESETPPTIITNTFYNKYLKEIIVPKGTLDVYKSATNWSNFADYIVEASE